MSPTGVVEPNSTVTNDNVTLNGDPGGTVTANSSGGFVGPDANDVGETPLIPFAGPWDDTIVVTFDNITETYALDADPF